MVLITLTGCNSRHPENNLVSQIHPITNEKPTQQEKPYSNPVWIMGSDFISMINGIKTSSYGGENALFHFTSAITKTRHKKEYILNYYKKANFSYLKKLKSSNKIGNDLYILNYRGIHFGTGIVKTYTVSVERDTCRLVLP